MKLDLGRTKSIDLLLSQHSDRQYALKKALGAGTLTALGVGATVGFAVYVLPGIAAANYGGRLIVISLLVDALLCFLFALCYAEVASTIPIAGSAYTYTYATLGEIPAWIIGWLLILEYLTITALVAHGIQAYLSSLVSDLSIHIGAAESRLLQAAPVIVIVMWTVVMVRGLRESAAANSFLVWVKLMALVIFLWLGISYLLKSHQPTAHRGLSILTSAWNTWGIKGLLSGAAVLVSSFMGIDAISTASEEAKNARRDIPVSTLGTVIITGTFTIAVTAVLLALPLSNQLGVLNPLAVATDEISAHKIGSFLVESGALITLISSLQVILLGLSRTLFSMARDGLLPAVFSRVHSRFKTPFLTTLIVGCSAAIVTICVPVHAVIELASAAFLLSMVLTSVAAMGLRYSKPNLPRAFRAPLFPFIPIVVALGALVLILSLPLSNLLRIVTWIAIGLILYFFYGHRHSRIAATTANRR